MGKLVAQTFQQAVSYVQVRSTREDQEGQRQIVKLTLYLRSGQTVEVDVKDVTRKYNGLNHFTALEWTNTDNDDDVRLFSINIDEIVAMTTHDFPPRRMDMANLDTTPDG